MAIDALLKLADRIENRLKSRADFNSDIDAVESYPGDERVNPDGTIELIPNSEKLQAAQNAVIDDLNSIAHNYEMYKNQLEQAQSQIYAQRFLFHYAKQLQEAIAFFAQQGNAIDTNKLTTTIETIAAHARHHWPSNANKDPRKGFQPLSELQSLRILSALIKDEASKSMPKLPPIDYVALSKRYRDEDSREDLRESERNIRNAPENEELTQPRLPISETMRSQMNTTQTKNKV